MKALTLRPHWAWFAVNGPKEVEDRSLPTRLRRETIAALAEATVKMRKRVTDQLAQAEHVRFNVRLSATLMEGQTVDPVNAALKELGTGEKFQKEGTRFHFAL